MDLTELRRIDAERRMDVARASLIAAKAQLEREIPAFIGLTETREQMEVRYGYIHVAEQFETKLVRSDYMRRFWRLLRLK